MAANPNALFLLADHIKLSLLERQRSKALDLLQEDNSASGGSAGANSEEENGGHDAQDGHISRSLDQFREGLASLRHEQERLQGEDASKALLISDALPALQKQLDTLTAQFEGKPTTATTKSALAATVSKKSVRFQDSRNKPLPATPGERPFPGKTTNSSDIDLEAQRAGLFGQRPYRDDPDGSGSGPAGEDVESLDNTQLHQMHSRIMADQDAQLDALGASISRQRELSMQIGDELDSHVAMLEESEQLVDRHQGRLDRARRQIGRISRHAGGDCRQMAAIVALIIFLVLLIAVLK